MIRLSQLRIYSVAALVFFGLASAALAGELIRAQGQKVDKEYIVVLNEGFAASQVAEGLSRTHGGRVETVWESALNGALFVDMNENQARALANNPMIAWVEENGVATIDATQSGATWGLDRIDQRNLPLNSQYTYNYDGSNVHAYVLDTGIRSTHNDFKNASGTTRATKDYDAIGDGQNGNDCHGHGTHVAATLGGLTYGVAKDVKIHAVRVLNCSGNGTWDQVISGVNWVTANAIKPAVANMSLGGGANASVDTAVNNSVNSGIFYAVAAGNNNANACNYSPARATQAYTVGSTTSSDQRSSFSNYGTCLNVFAPGSGITSAWYTSNTATNTIDGTSMASPHVAGVAALVLDQFPSYSVSQVKTEITNRATTGKVSNPGTGSPNLLLYSLGSTPPPGPAAPTLSVQLEFCYGFNTLSWTTSSGATYYELWGSSTSSFTYPYLSYSGTATSRFVNVSGNTYFRVKACNSNGCSDYSNQVWARYYDVCY